MATKKPYQKPIDWTPHLKRLGTVPDQAIATELGVTRQRVRQVREQHGIAARGIIPAKPLPAELLKRLGTVKDFELAREYGVSNAQVSEARRERGIPMKRVECPSRTRYNAGCRCQPCTAVNTAQMREWVKKNPDLAAANKERMRVKVLASAPHKKGKVGWYAVGCRCDGCRLASAKYHKHYYEATKQAKEDHAAAV